MFGINRNLHYRNKLRAYLRDYWKYNDGSDYVRPNGFTDIPEQVYNCFCREISGNGKILDMGCGNGLLLKYLMDHTAYKLLPFGIDFCRPSIKQAQSLIHPTFKNNFRICNIRDFDFRDSPYDYILFCPDHVYQKDILKTVKQILCACSENGKVVFYTYGGSTELTKPYWADILTCLTGYATSKKEYTSVYMQVCQKINPLTGF